MKGKTKQQISYNMSRVKRSGTSIERTLGSALWAAGIRYRKQYSALLGRPDFALVGARVAIFCDSSFWHGRYWPSSSAAFKSNREFWIPKIESNIARDREVEIQLTYQGWKVIRFWDDDILRNTDRCVARIRRILNAQKTAR